MTIIIIIIIIIVIITVIIIFIVIITIIIIFIGLLLMAFHENYYRKFNAQLPWDISNDGVGIFMEIPGKLFCQSHSRD